MQSTVGNAEAAEAVRLAVQAAFAACKPPLDVTVTLVSGLLCLDGAGFKIAHALQIDAVVRTVAGVGVPNGCSLIGGRIFSFYVTLLPITLFIRKS